MVERWIELPPLPDWETSGGFGDSYTRNGVTYRHRGWDVIRKGGGSRGAQLQVMADGVAVEFRNGPGSNNKGQPTFGHGLCTYHPQAPDEFRYLLMAHMEEPSPIRVGQRVVTGEVAGLMGDTGDADGVHSHIQLCTSPTFPVDISQSANPRIYLLTEEERMSLQSRIDRLEAVVIGNGFDAICRPGTEDLFPPGTPVVPEGQSGPVVRLTGEAAVEYGKRRGFSLGLAINGLNDVVRTHLEAHP